MGKDSTIYACDFDGTLCESIWPGIGSPNLALISHLIRRRERGDKIILWTCRAGGRLQEAVEWCKGYGLEFDAVNENLPETIECFGSDSRKIHADVYIDDKAADKPEYRIPYREGAQQMEGKGGKAEMRTLKHAAICLLCIAGGAAAAYALYILVALYAALKAAGII